MWEKLGIRNVTPRHTLIVRLGGNNSLESTLTDHSSIFIGGGGGVGLMGERGERGEGGLREGL